MVNLKAREFLNQNFLLESEAARVLYQQYAAPMPILDYHNHLSPKDIAENRKFRNLTEIWLEGDHYKWRAMRINGVDERYCTGNASPEDKFRKWAETVPYTMRNPLYHWTHLELKNYFGITKLLSSETAREIYALCSAMLQDDQFSTLGLLRKMNVEVVCTTDDPADDLRYHKQFSSSTSAVKMYPTFRPDKSYSIEDVPAYNEYLTHLGPAAGIDIKSFDDLLQALSKRIDFFDSLGCRASDHGLDYICFAREAEKFAPTIFQKLREGKEPDQHEIAQYKSALLLNLGRMYHRKGWVQQFHLGALRNNNSRLLRELGRDTGFDSMGDYPQAATLSAFMNALENTNQLTRTIIYNNNPSDNEVFATMIGNFHDGSIPGKIQFGSGWWFLDQKDGMERQMNALSNMGLISRFIGMVTDSRSFLSFPRHEYFRRILCNLWGNDVEKGLLPDDLNQIGEIIEGICCHNARSYFNFNNNGDKGKDS
jgi:glucuronate isomerase